MKVLFFLKIILTFFILHNFAYSKGLPPGTGSNDIPANVLILLDKSASMTLAAVPPGDIYEPQAIAVDHTEGSTDSSSYVGMSSFIVKVDYNTNVIDDTWAFAASGKCLMGNIKELRIHTNKLYVIDYTNDVLFRIDLTSKSCEFLSSINNPRSMDIKGDILYATGEEMLVFDLSNAKPLAITCAYNGELKSDGQDSLALAIDSSGENLYFHNNGELKRHQIGDDECPSLDRTSTIDTEAHFDVTHGFIFEPDSDDVIYMPSYDRDKFFKVTLNASKTSADFEDYTQILYNLSSPSTADNTFIDYPFGIDIDPENERIHFVSRGAVKHAMHVISYAGVFNKEYVGGDGKTRMDGAVEAIQAIVLDSTLSSNVNFGFGVWSESGASFNGWNDQLDEAIPCGDLNCLKVRVEREGAAKINTVVPTIIADGDFTISASFANLAKDYYLHSSSPIDINLDCQNSHIIIIGDGDYSDVIDNPVKTILNLNSSNKIKTHMVAYGGGISVLGMVEMEQFAVAGGTKKVIIAASATSLKSQLRDKISQIVAENFAFTAPSIPPNKNETSTAVYQSSFKHKTNQSWRGSLIRTTIDADGNLQLFDDANWTANDVVPDPKDRSIWSIIPGSDYKTDYNNFVETNASSIGVKLKNFGYEIADYHSVSNNPATTQRCNGRAAGVEDGTADDIKGLINFLRGEDYFDYDGDCVLDEIRLDLDEDGELVKTYLGDFYHSELLVVGAPDANTSFTNKSQESYWRFKNKYDAWAAGANVKNRKKIIYVGGNDGMLHAFNSENGVEEWAFIPPLLFGNLPQMTNKTLNIVGGGGSTAIYGVDGSPVVHDMFITHPITGIENWYTILFVPYGRGGNGFTILDVTNPDTPFHLFSTINDSITKSVHVIDEVGRSESYRYVSSSYNISQLKEAKKVTSNFSNSLGNEICDDTGNNQCYQSNTWTLVTAPKIANLKNADFKVTKGGNNINFNTRYENGDIVFTFDENIRYVAYGSSGGLASTDLTIFIDTNSVATGVQGEPGYDYSRLAQTWSQPRIIRMPNNGAGDTNIDDDIYVAVLGGGFGGQTSSLGSDLFIINLEVDPTDGLYAKIEKRINIEDLDNDIINSTPALPVVITSDEISSNYTGALVYLNDLEGKITKFNLTNMSVDNQGQPIALYDSTTLFNSDATQTNGRYMYHSMDAGTLKGSNKLWMYVGTGDFIRLTEKDSNIDNLLLGIRDKDFPYYRDVNTANQADNLTDCSDTTTDIDGDDCPTSAELGWVIHLADSEKVTAEPTLTKGRVLFPIFQPNKGINACDTGKAFICNVDAKCGSPKNSEISLKDEEVLADDQCLEVGEGVLTKVVIFANKIFSNISGVANEKSRQGTKSDLVSIDAGNSVIQSFRNSWRENY